MAVWKLTESDYDKVLASERHHFVHLNVTSVQPDRTVHMTFSAMVATMLRKELGITLIEFKHPDHPITHPDDSYILSGDDLRRVALNAPGFNPARK